MLEKMAEFFDSRLCGYDSHMLQCIEGAEEFYPYTASLLPKKEGAVVLDLGCGTGLELKEYFALNPSASVTCIDLAPGMLGVLKNRFPGKEMTLINGSYFDEEFGVGIFDAAVSVESLHHYTRNEKIPLYKKLYHSLKPKGYFILTDYFALSNEEEELLQNELRRAKKQQMIKDSELYHFDTPLTVEHEAEALMEAGFTGVEVLKRWGATRLIKAVK